MALFCTAARIAAREANRPKPARQKPKPWPWQVRLIWLVVVVGIAVQYPAGRVILAVIGGLMVVMILGVVGCAFTGSSPKATRTGRTER